MEGAHAYILERMQKQGDYEFLPEGLLTEMLQKLIALDDAYMKIAGVEEGEEYDDDAALQALFDGMSSSFADYRMYMRRMTEDYLDYNEEYLDSIGAIDWE